MFRNRYVVSASESLLTKAGAREGAVACLLGACAHAGRTADAVYKSAAGVAVGTGKDGERADTAKAAEQGYLTGGDIFFAMFMMQVIILYTLRLNAQYWKASSSYFSRPRE